MTTIEAVLVAGSFLHFLAALTYVRNNLLGRSQPNRVTFFLWGVIPMIALAAGFVEGGAWALLPVFMSGFAPFLVFLSSFFNPKAYWKLGRLDYLCGFLAVLAILLWVTTQSPALAVAFSILADAFAGIPTLIKAWRYPETETGNQFVVALLTEIVGLFALTAYTFAEYGFLVYLILVNTLLVIGVYRHDPIGKLKRELAS